MPTPIEPSQARAEAPANIALCKYWGKSDELRKLPAVPSLSLTLSDLKTRTTVTFRPDLARDELELDGVEASGIPLARAVGLLDQIRADTGEKRFARVVSQNNFPTASGLASSASGFSALAAAGLAAAGASLTPRMVSELARRASVSAARSAYGGFVELPEHAEWASPLQTPLENEVALVVAMVEKGPKKTGSSEGMAHTQATSPYYSAWVASSRDTFARMRAALLAGDLAQVGTEMEHSTLCMHASMQAAKPGLLYWKPVTVALMHAVVELRSSGHLAYFTMDAGPHVKVLTSRREAAHVRTALAQVPGVLDCMVCSAGTGTAVVPAPEDATA